jgi:hypothetical protein
MTATAMATSTATTSGSAASTTTNYVTKSKEFKCTQAVKWRIEAISL